MKKSILCSANLVSVRFPSIFCVIKGPIFRIGNLHCSLLQILHYSDIYVPRVLSISSTFHFFRFTFLGRVNRMIVKKFRTTWYTLGYLLIVQVAGYLKGSFLVYWTVDVLWYDRSCLLSCQLFKLLMNLSLGQWKFLDAAKQLIFLFFSLHRVFYVRCFLL